MPIGGRCKSKAYEIQHSLKYSPVLKMGASDTGADISRSTNIVSIRQKAFSIVITSDFCGVMACKVILLDIIFRCTQFSMSSLILVAILRLVGREMDFCHEQHCFELSLFNEKY